MPLIQHEMLSYTAQNCSIILRCLVPAGSGAQTTWQHENTSSATWIQSYNSHVLHLNIPASALNAIYTCVAWNPAQRRSKSVDLAELCAQGKVSHCPPLPHQVHRASRPSQYLVPIEAHRWRWPIYLAVLVGVVGALSIALYLLKRRRKADRGGRCCGVKAAAWGAASRRQEAVPIPHGLTCRTAAACPEELQYSHVQRRDVEDRDEQVGQ